MQVCVGYSRRNWRCNLDVTQSLTQLHVAQTTLYTFELKLDKNATVAMEQINLKNYSERFALCGLPIVKVAVNFDSKSCTLGDWRIEKV